MSTMRRTITTVHVVLPFCACAKHYIVVVVLLHVVVGCSTT